ncbi:aminoglycoside phosphotransferase family protein [Psychrobacillus sp.]|uniref:aminoglycoside phosphotransferase family protein n=1 Tax=Psychrobacillus sp. TaxID=1871623 RepID=UPI0028BED92A|nr:aminoglycoside phosphotransferase family protein [Psychrobacillus sp.]
MNYPISFENKIIGTFGEEGKVWLNKLESIIQFYLNKWELELISPVENLSYNYILQVKDAAGTPAILKLGIAGDSAENEIRTLHLYDGNGCVKLLKEDAKGGAMLLEHLLPGTMLVVEKDEKLAVKHFAQVWKKTRRPAPPNSTNPSIAEWIKAFELRTSIISSQHIQQAKAYFTEIMNASTGEELLHGDLHHENILYDHTGGWIAIDPKGVIGDRYFDVIAFLTNQLFHKENPKEALQKRVDLLCEALEFDKERLLKAGFVMSILFTCWGIEDNDSIWRNTYTCAKWFEELINNIDYN